MADLKQLCIKCRGYVHPVFPCSKTTVADNLLCRHCYMLPPVITHFEGEKLGKKNESTTLKDVPPPGDDNVSTTEATKPKKRTRRQQRGKGSAPTQSSPRNQKKLGVGTGQKDKNDLKGLVKELFTAPPEADENVPEDKKQVVTEPTEETNLELNVTD